VHRSAAVRDRGIAAQERHHAQLQK
jgi:hypothetical protein